MLLKELSEAIGVSGDEAAVRKIILNEIKDHVTDIHIDSIGNLTAYKKGSRRKNTVRVMLAAHMDEIGFMVTGIESNGLVQFTKVGGVAARILPGLRVKVGKKQLPGVILWAPIHVNRDQKVVPLKNLYIDIGSSKKSETESKVKRGDRIAFDSRFMEIGKTTLRGKAFDDRVGCALLVDVLKNGPYGADVLAAFTVQEEIGLRGAKVAAERLKPDIAIAIEGTTAHDLPNPSATPDDINTPNPACVQGGGPVLTVMDRSMITNPNILRFLRSTAEKHDIPYQLKTALGGGTDAGAIHQSHAGVPSGVVSVPCRYIHSPTATLNRNDYDHTLSLLQAALKDITPASVAWE